MKSEIAERIQNRVSGAAKFKRLVSDTITDWMVRRNELRLDLLEYFVDDREEWHRKRLAKYGELLSKCMRSMYYCEKAKIECVSEQLYHEASEWQKTQKEYGQLYKYLIRRMTR